MLNEHRGKQNKQYITDVGALLNDHRGITNVGAMLNEHRGKQNNTNNTSQMSEQCSTNIVENKTKQNKITDVGAMLNVRSG